MRKGLDELRTRFWYKKVFEVSKCSNNKQLAESFSGKGSNTSTQWASYKKGKKVPTIYLSLVHQKYGITEEDFKKGPRSLLEIMELGRLRGISRLFFDEFDHLCHEKGRANARTLFDQPHHLEQIRIIPTTGLTLVFDTQFYTGFLL